MAGCHCLRMEASSWGSLGSDQESGCAAPGRAGWRLSLERPLCRLPMVPRRLPSLLCRCVGVRHGVFQASETGAEAGGGGTQPPRSLETLDGMSIAPLGTPASEPVGPVSQPPGA